METIGQQKIWSFFDASMECRIVDNTTIRKGSGHNVGSFLELARKIAELQFRNRDHVLLFRGQGGDHPNMQGNTALKPTLLRPKDKGNPTPEMLLERFALLERAEQILVEEYASSKFLGLDKLQRHRIIRWSILQHYEVCATPLLDVTHSLRIAASFASLAKTNPVYLMVVGVPNLSGAITASAEAGLQIMRLSSVCPPSAVRPHIQEGYLLGVYPELGAYADKENYDDYEMDFGRRLVAKFVFDPGSFWKDDDFPQVAEHALYPSEQDDPLHALASRVQRAIGKP